MPSMQVFDLQEFRPGQVLQQIYKNFEDAERRGDHLAASLKRSAFVVGVMSTPSLNQVTAGPAPV